MRNLPSYRYVITISENTKKDLIEVTGFPVERIHVAYPGCHRRFTVIGRTVVKRYLAVKKLPPRYILFLGTMDPRKNIRRLLESYALLSKRLRREYCLVLAGWEGWDYEGVIKTIDKLGIGPSITYLGYVPDEETPLLYNGASLFVYPSIYEGFGLPPLEAMACGCPVITSNTSSLPEVVGEEGVMVDPYNEYDLRDKMEMILTGGRMSADLREYGLKRARVYSWETCAQRTLEIYNKAVE
jgi:glycosyltransferase involved in cell wall biosynthesis